MTKEKDDIPASTRIGQYIDNLNDWRGATLARIRDIFLAADPAMKEEWKWMGSPVWSCSGQIAVANAHKAKVKVTFTQGAHLADPLHVFNNGLGGNQWRAIDLVDGDDIDGEALTNLIRAAIQFNQNKRNK